MPLGEQVARTFRDRVVAELFDAGSLDEMNTVLAKWNLLLRPTTSVNLRPELVVLPRYPLEARGYQSDELYPPMRLPSPLPGILSTLQRGAPRTTLQELGVYQGDPVVSVPDVANRPGRYASRLIKSTLLNFSDPAANQADTDVTIGSRGSAIPPLYLPELQDGALFDIAEGKARQELEWSAQTVSLRRRSKEYIAPRHQFRLDGETYAVSEVTHEFDANVGYTQEIVGVLVQDAAKRFG